MGVNVRGRMPITKMHNRLPTVARLHSPQTGWPSGRTSTGPGAGLEPHAGIDLNLPAYARTSELAITHAKTSTTTRTAMGTCRPTRVSEDQQERLSADAPNRRCRPTNASDGWRALWPAPSHADQVGPKVGPEARPFSYRCVRDSRGGTARHQSGEPISCSS